MLRWVHADPEKVERRSVDRKKSICIALDSNYFTGPLSVNVDGYLFFKGKNKIGKIEYLSASPYLQFGPYQRIDKKGNHAESHKDIFLELLEKANERNDQVQVRTLEVEIKKCDRHILRREKFSLSNAQDRFILLWGSWVSGYSTSWLRPILWMTGFNLFFTFFTLAVLCVCHDVINQPMFATLFIEFYNPLTSPAQVLGLEKAASPSPMLSLINIFQKVFFTAFLYETIKAFRRFVAK